MTKNNASALALVDIDDMWCHTARKFGKYVGDPKTVGQPCVFDEGGKPVSFRSAPQAGMLDLLLAGARVIPCTGRSVSKYRRVQLGFNDYAITSFGGVILTPDGEPEAGWHSEMSRAASVEAENMRGMLALAREGAARINGGDLSVELISDAGLDLVIKVQSKDGVQAHLDELGACFNEQAPVSWMVHLNDGQLSAFPRFLGKVQACRYFLENLAGSPSLVIGCGDSLSDLGFIGLCHFMVTPTQSQIFRTVSESATEGE
jgi:hydroxymethylpyrimidine pyrophosphatase-like HAD family hydrolase